MIDRASLIDASVRKGEKPTGPVTGMIELKDVTFAYPTRPEVHVFAHFSLTVPAGKITALVGESGSGKSTIVNLVERFYDVQVRARPCSHACSLRRREPRAALLRRPGARAPL